MAEFKEIVDDGSDCDDLVEEAYAYLVSKKYPECVSETKKRVTAIQGFDSGPVTARNITRKSVLPNFARHVLTKS